MKNFKFLGYYLRTKRKDQCLTQKAVARYLGYPDYQFISNWERGKCAPALKSLRKLVKLYKLNAVAFMDILMEVESEHLKRVLKID